MARRHRDRQWRQTPRTQPLDQDTLIQRVLVVGTTNAGKTTMARRLAARIGAPHVELDALFWGPNWAEASDEDFFANVANRTAGDSWVVCGNYSRVQHLLWPRADTMVWLDPPLRVILRRAIFRTVRRSVLRTELWASGNRERISNLWSDKDSLYSFAKSSHPRRTERYEAAIESAELAHIEVVRLRSPKAARGWLRSVPPS
jgi:adenylate kinase family enzyme